MKLRRAKSAGFCFGVRRAITIALDAARSGPNVCMLGDIVHNETVIDELRRAGIRKLKTLGRGAGKILLVRAHGAGRKMFRDARRAGYRIVDATCPMVKEIHAIAQKMECAGRTVIIIGDEKHDEVRGIVGQLKRKPLVISCAAAIGKLRQRWPERAGIVVQSTQDEEMVLAIVARLKRLIPDLVFRNTICNPTRTKQAEAKTLPKENDAVIVIGSRTSGNTKRLYEISRSRNSRTYWVNSADQLQKAWFRDIASVGVTAGASTPEDTIDAVLAKIRSFGS